jgi:hypothetical protein
MSKMFEEHELPVAAFEDIDPRFSRTEISPRLLTEVGELVVVDDIVIIRLDSSQFTLFSLN